MTWPASWLAREVMARGPVTISAVAGKVRWEMTPGRARKVARLLRNYSNALSEADRLDTAATQAEEPPRSIHSQ